MAASHSRKSLNRASLQRRRTRGPLDDDEDPLSDQLSPPLSTSGSNASPLIASAEGNELNIPMLSDSVQSKPTSTLQDSVSEGKDLSFLLDASIYHPLSHIDTPPPFRKPLPSPPPSGTTIEQIFARLEHLLSQCDFLGAAHLAGSALAAGILRPTDNTSIFHLLAIRFSALELCGNVLLAAQEAKALEDLTSSFYYHDATLPENARSLPEEQRPQPMHVMPFDLRLQALRLQGIGFSDPRRGVSALYDLGLECREHLASPLLNKGDFELWSERLEEVGMRVINSLIEMGDLDCASRTLFSTKHTDQTKSNQRVFRAILLLLKMGEIDRAQQLLATSKLDQSEKAFLDSLLAVADGRYEDAADLLSKDSSTNTESALFVIGKQNLAIAYLYMGAIHKTKEILAELVEHGHSFQALTVNLATLYDLSSDRSRDMKVTMATQVASIDRTKLPTRAFVNADFKL